MALSSLRRLGDASGRFVHLIRFVAAAAVSLSFVRKKFR